MLQSVVLAAPANLVAGALCLRPSTHRRVRHDLRRARATTGPGRRPGGPAGTRRRWGRGAAGRCVPVGEQGGEETREENQRPRPLRNTYADRREGRHHPVGRWRREGPPDCHGGSEVAPDPAASAVRRPARPRCPLDGAKPAADSRERNSTKCTARTWTTEPRRRSSVHTGRAAE